MASSDLIPPEAPTLGDPAAAELERLRLRVQALEQSMHALTLVAHPRLPEIYQKIVDGLDFFPNSSAWRAHGFHFPEDMPGGQPAIWSDASKLSTIDFFFLDRSEYAGSLKLAATPNVLDEGVALSLNGQPLPCEQEGGDFYFDVQTTYSGWHSLAVVCPRPAPVAPGSADRRALGFLLLECRVRPKLQLGVR